MGADVTEQGFSSITFTRDRRVVPLADPGELLAHLADPGFDFVVAVLPDEPDPDHFAQAAEAGGAFAFEVWRGGEPVVEQLLATPAEVVEAFRTWATGPRP